MTCTKNDSISASSALISNPFPPTTPKNLLFLFCLLLMATACERKIQASPSPEATDSLPSAINISQKNTSPMSDTLSPSFDKDYLMGHFDPAVHPDFVRIADRYASRTGLYMRREAYEAFKRMHEAAAAEGIRLKILSAARNFNYQKGLWEAKWTGARRLSDGTNAARDIQAPTQRALRILEYSAMPGASRHHWGTDIDLNALNNAYFSSGEGLRVFTWLEEHAPGYGFCRPYIEKGEKRPNGYNEEKWHWSYRPLAGPMLQSAKTNLRDEDITGFRGAETATDIRIIKNYVLGVSQECFQ